MGIFFHSRWKKFCRNQDGAATVEFSLLALTFVFIIGIIVDFGHFFYLQQILTNASREGARYGCLYKSNGTHATAGEIQTYIQQKYGPSLGYSSGAGPGVNVQGAGGATLSDLTVTVTGTKNWFFLNSFINQLANSNYLKNPSIATTMKLE